MLGFCLGFSSHPIPSHTPHRTHAHDPPTSWLTTMIYCLLKSPNDSSFHSLLSSVPFRRFFRVSLCRSRERTLARVPVSLICCHRWSCHLYTWIRRAFGNRILVVSSFRPAKCLKEGAPASSPTNGKMVRSALDTGHHVRLSHCSRPVPGYTRTLSLRIWPGIQTRPSV